MSNQEYGNESIRRLSDREAVRTRVSTYAGSADREGAFTTVKEIISNSIDEFKEGYGNEIYVKYNQDNSITVKDKGRGIPMDWNEGEQEYNYNLLLFTLNAGGKYGNENYEYSIGLNGIGAGLATMSSEYAYISSIRDGYVYDINSLKGSVEGKLSKKRNTNNLPTGTSVTWKPDVEVFDEIDFPEKWFLEYIKRQAIVNKGLKIVFENKEEKSFIEHYEEGIADYLKEINDEKGFTQVRYFETDDMWGRDRKDREDYKTKYEVAYVFNNENSTMESYHNSSYLSEGGSPHDAIKSAFVYEIDKRIKLLNKYNKSESKVSFDDIKESLIIITNTYSTETAYKNQTKLAISNKFVKDTLNNLLRERLHVYFVENPDEAEKIVDQVLVNKRSREKAEKTRLDVKKKLGGKINTMATKVEGFYNCKEKDPKKRSLAICEGKSALASILSGRPDNVAIMPIRGKILNCYKHSEDRIFSSDVVTNLLKVIGCGVEVGKKGSKTHTFDMDSMNVDKILIYVDFDEDGVGSILPLLLTMFEKLTPTLLKEGKIYLGKTPKYEVKMGSEDFYIFDDRELKKFREANKDAKFTLHYIKGLAELSSEAMTMCLDESYGNIIQITAEESESLEILQVYMGKDNEDRKRILLDSFEMEDVVIE